MIAQPRGERLRRAIREEVDRAVLLQIDNDRGVDATCAEGEIVNADDRSGWATGTEAGWHAGRGGG